MAVPRRPLRKAFLFSVAAALATRAVELRAQSAGLPELSATPVEVASHGDEPRADLSLRLRPGMEWTNILTVSSSTTMRVEDSARARPLPEVKVEQRERMTLRVAVESVQPNGTSTLRFTYRRVEVRSRGSGGARGGMEYDSDAKGVPVPPDAAGYPAMIGRSVGVDVARDGTIVGVDLEDLYDSVRRDPAVAPERREALVAALRASLGAEAVKAGLGGTFCHVPTSAVGPGARWSVRLTGQAGGMTYQSTAVHSVAKVADATVEVKMEAAPDGPPGGDGFAQKGVTIENFSASTSATKVFERATGLHTVPDMTARFRLTLRRGTARVHHSSVTTTTLERPE